MRHVWISAAASRLRLFDRVVSRVVRISDGLVVRDLERFALHFAVLYDSL